MKNIDTDTMVTIKVASKELGVSKGKIKDIIKNKEISFELINGIYYVDLNDVREKLNMNVFSYINDREKFLTENKDFLITSIKNSNYFVNKKFGYGSYIINSFFLNYFIFRKFGLCELEKITKGLLEYFPVEDSTEFHKMIDKTFINSFVINKFENYINLFYLGFKEYIIIFETQQDSNGYIINNIYRKSDFNFSKFERYFSIEKVQSMDISSKFECDYYIPLEILLEVKINGSQIYEYTIDFLKYITDIDINQINKLKDLNLIGNKNSQLFSITDILIINELKKTPYIIGSEIINIT